MRVTISQDIDAAARQRDIRNLFTFTVFDWNVFRARRNSTFMQLIVNSVSRSWQEVRGGIGRAGPRGRRRRRWLTISWLAEEEEAAQEDEEEESC